MLTTRTDRPRLLAPVAHWAIDVPPTDAAQPREHAVSCGCGRRRTFHASGRCPSCR